MAHSGYNVQKKRLQRGRLM